MAMIIRDQQIKAFREVSLSRFGKRMVKFVRENYNQKVSALNDEALNKNIRTLMDQAEGFGFKTEYEVMRFISLNYFYNWNGKITDEQILKLFRNKGFTPKQKFMILKDILKTKS